MCHKVKEIYGRLDGMFMANAPTSLGLKQLARSIHKRNNSEGFLKLREKVEKIIESAAAYGYYISINDYLMPEEMKYIIVTGKYEGEKFSLFKKKEYKGNKVELNERVNEDSRRIVVDSFNRSIVILEDLFETLFDEIGYIVKDFLLYDFGIKLYDIFGERNIDCVFPEIKDHIDYKKVKDPFLITRYIVEGYTHPVYGNNIQIDKDQSVLVLGTNNTGKTVMLRTIGICQIFAQTGLFVPADYACVDIRKDIISIFSGEEKDTNVGGRFEKEVIDIKDIIDEKTMLYPTIKELTKDEFNRYELALATAKCARMITDEYVRQREAAEKSATGNKEVDRNLINMINKEYRDEKAVKNAINRIHNGEYKILHKEETEQPAEEAEAEEAAEVTEA